MGVSLTLPGQDFIKSLAQKSISLDVRFLCSGLSLADLPPSRAPEFAFVGRSNVGKSSLLNFLAGQRQLARTSRTPGRTQLINLFSAEQDQFRLVDLPGYGYAESPRESRAQWQAAMRDFFEGREALFCVLFLVDIRRDLQNEDKELASWFSSLGLHVIGVQTKCDKIHKRDWAERSLCQSRDLGLRPEQMVVMSAEKKWGRQDLFRHMAGKLEVLAHALENHTGRQDLL